MNYKYINDDPAAFSNRLHPINSIPEVAARLRQYAGNGCLFSELKHICHNGAVHYNSVSYDSKDGIINTNKGIRYVKDIDLGLSGGLRANRSIYLSIGRVGNSAPMSSHMPTHYFSIRDFCKHNRSTEVPLPGLKTGGY